MKSTYLLIIAMMFSIISLNAQSPWSIGAKTGLSYSNLAVDDDVNEYSFGTGYHLGAFVQYRKVNVGLQTEFVFTNQNTTVQVEGENLDFNMQYLSIPLLVSYHVTPSLSFSFGPQTGILLCAKSEYHPVTREKYEEQHYTKAYKKTDFGLSAGLGLASPKGFLTSVRYYHGLEDISNFDGVASTKNRSIQLSVGYRFQL